MKHEEGPQVAARTSSSLEDWWTQKINYFSRYMGMFLRSFGSTTTQLWNSIQVSYDDDNISFIYLFFEKLFTEHQLCIRHWSNQQGPTLRVFTVWEKTLS